MIKKYFILFSSAILIATSCTKIVDFPELFNGANPDTSGYYAARNLEGLGSFLIGKSTYLQTLNDLKEAYRNDERYHYFNYGNGFGEVFSGLKEIQFDSVNKNQYNSIFTLRYLACNDVRIIGCYNYYMDDIEISDLVLTFYNDILIRIDCRQNDKIDEIFSLSHGAGKVKKETFWFTPNGKTNKKPDKELLDNGKADILSNYSEVIWENSAVKTTSYSRIKYKYENRRLTGIDYTINEFSIVSKDEIRNNEMISCDSISRLNNVRTSY